MLLRHLPLQEFNEIHSSTAKQQLKEYYIGVLRLPDESA